MGSSGMKRKGRKHLPKVGSRRSDEYELHDRRERALHPFSADPGRRRGAGTRIAAAIVGGGVVVGVVAIIIAT